MKKAVKVFYRPEDTAHLDYARDLGDPGQFPFTRGIHPQMYRSRLWTMRQYAGYATATESNARYRYLLEQGARGLSVAFDLPTQIGLDSDHELAKGEVGRVGVAINSMEDMERLFEGIPLDEVSTSMTINATAAILLALYFAVARKRGIDWKALRGTVQNDILKEYIARGTYIYPPAASLRLVTDVFEFCSLNAPKWNAISVSGYHIREAGSTAAQELAFTLSNGAAYIEAALARGMDVDAVAPQMSFFFNAHNGFFEEAAKFRAARRIWARLMKDEYGAKEERSQMLRFHAQTAGSSLTAQQPDNNIVRVALQALAAVCGGAQSLHTNARDEALALPTEQSAKLALRTQQILAHESGAAGAADPLGGSWYVEHLTGRLEDEALEYMEKVRNLGGMLAAIESGFVQGEIQEAAYQHQKGLEAGSEAVVGVNCFREDAQVPIEILRIDPGLEMEQVRRLEEMRRRRDPAKVDAALASIRQAAAGADNLVPHLIDAVEALTTVGEVSDALRQVFGEHRETIAI